MNIMHDGKEIEFLIVDSSELMRDRLKLILDDSELFGEIHLAANPESALKIFREFDPAFVVMNVKLGDITGTSVLRKMKSINRKVVIVMIAALSFDKYRQVCLDSGADYFMNSTEDFETLPSLCIKLAS